MTVKGRIQYVQKLITSLGIASTANYLYERSIKPKNSIIHVTVPGLSHKVLLRNKTYDIHIFFQIFVQEDLKFDYGDSVSTIMDCGANIGLATLYYIKKFPDSRIISVEPEENNYKMLLANTQHYPNVRPLQNGIYGEDCDLEILDTGEGEASYRTVASEGCGKVLNHISCKTIDHLMKDFRVSRIDILKMDIEGSERSCLLSPHIEWLHKTRFFLVEIHERIWPGLTKEILTMLPSASKVCSNGEYTIIINQL